jgi:hypothetical protein
MRECRLLPPLLPFSSLQRLVTLTRAMTHSTVTSTRHLLPATAAGRRYAKMGDGWGATGSA